MKNNFRWTKKTECKRKTKLRQLSLRMKKKNERT